MRKSTKITKIISKPRMKQSNTQKLSNIINLNNPFLQTDPELMKLLKQILAIINKKRKYRRQIQQSKLIQGNTLGMKYYIKKGLFDDVENKADMWIITKYIVDNNLKIKNLEEVKNEYFDGLLIL